MDEIAELFWSELGRQAFLAGESSAPTLNRVVRDVIEKLPVGGGAGDIFRAYTAGWHTANLAAI